MMPSEMVCGAAVFCFTVYYVRQLCLGAGHSLCLGICSNMANGEPAAVFLLVTRLRVPVSAVKPDCSKKSV